MAKTGLKRRTELLPFSPPLIGEEEIEEVVDTLRSGWITTGPKTKRFEEDFAAKFGTGQALALSSCTGGLHIALAAHGIGPGDEVIVPTMTFCATANVVVHQGATPVLVDVCPDTLNIDPECVQRAVTERTKAIIPVHYAGHPYEWDGIQKTAEKHGLAVIEDAAHAIDAKYRGRNIGSSCNLSAFSFYATKNLTTGEGGMLTGPKELIEKSRTLSLHGMSKDAFNRYDKGGSWYYEVEMPGFKYNMTDIQAAIGIWQLKKLNGFQERRREVVDAYNTAFSSVASLEIPTELPHVESSLHLYVLRLNLDSLKIDRGSFIENLLERNVATSVHYIPLHMQPYYRDRFGYTEADFPVASRQFERMISLPLHPGLSDEDVQDVVAAVLDVATQFSA